MSDKSTSFKYRREQMLEQAGDFDLARHAHTLGLETRGSAVIIDFYGRRIGFQDGRFTDLDNQPLTDAVQWVLCRYLLHCPDKEVQTSCRLVSFREFEGAGVLYDRFATNTAKIIETTFAGKKDQLEEKCLILGATPVETSGYDISARFRALSRIPVFLNFNDMEDDMPASAAFLFYDSAEHYLDLECMTILATYLTGSLIQSL